MTFNGTLLVDLTVTAVLAFSVRAAIRPIIDPGVMQRRDSLDGSTSDSMVHALMVQAIRANRHRIPWNTERFLLSPEFRYPAFFHFLVALLPEKLVQRGEWLINPLVEAAHACIVFIMMFVVCRYYLGVDDWVPLSFAAAIGFTLTPLFWQDPLRYCMLCPRSFSFMAGNIFIFSNFMFCASGQWLWLALAIPAFAVGLASGKFALQAMVFCSLSYSVVSLDWHSAAVLLIALAAAQVLTLGYAGRVLRGSLYHSWAYRKYYAANHIATRAQNDTAFRNFIANALHGRLRAAWDQLRRHPLHYVLYLVPWLWPLAFTTLPPYDDAIIGMMERWILCALVVTAIISMDRFKFLGEAHRYLDYAVFPAVALCLLGKGGVMVWLALFLVSLGLIALRIARLGPTVVSDPASRDLIAFVRTLPASVLAGTPGRVCFPLAYRTEHQVLWWFADSPRGHSMEVFLGFFNAGTPQPLIALKALEAACLAYHVDYVVIDKLGIATLKIGEYNYQANGVVFENERFIVCTKITSSSAGA